MTKETSTMNQIERLRLFAAHYSKCKGMPWIGTVRPEQAFAEAAETIDRLERRVAGAYDECEALALQWRDENKIACAKARKSFSEASADMADQLEGAAIECNAIAGAIRQAKAAALNPEPTVSEGVSL